MLFPLYVDAFSGGFSCIALLNFSFSPLSVYVDVLSVWVQQLVPQT